MILKDKSIQNTTSVTAKAGQKQEQDVAFFLRRAFKDHPQVFVINDYKFTFNNETAQIDHLIIYPYGFVLVESKSITGEVKVNDLGEWTRSLGNKWSGMPSPIKQVELQQKLLRQMLFEKREVILGKILGSVQQSFGGRCWDNLCAVSSNAIIHRKSIPNDISKQLVKTEFLTDKLEEVMRLTNKVIKAINFLDTRPNFSKEELKSIADFLLAQLEQKSKVDNTVNPKVELEQDPKPKAVHQPISNSISCKSCGEITDVSPKSGKYGYFIKCNKCETNTAMKTPCPSCNSKSTKVSKNKMKYTLRCEECDSESLLFQS